MSGWIDDPGERWVGFVIERITGHPDIYTPTAEPLEDFPMLVRVRPTPTPAPPGQWLEGEPIYEVHPADAARVSPLGGGSVCLHMGRLVE